MNSAIYLFMLIFSLNLVAQEGQDYSCEENTGTLEEFVLKYKYVFVLKEAGGGVLNDGRYVSIYQVERDLKDRNYKGQKLYVEEDTIYLKHPVTIFGFDEVPPTNIIKLNQKNCTSHYNLVEIDTYIANEIQKKRSPLWNAIYEYRYDEAKTLVTKQGVRDSTGEIHLDALSLLIDRGWRDLVDLFVALVPVDYVNKKGQNTFHYAVYGNDFELALSLSKKGARLNVSNDPEATPLVVFATISYNYKMLKLLDTMGGDFNLIHKDQNLLFWFVYGSSLRTLRLGESLDEEEIVKLLLDKKLKLEETALDKYAGAIIQCLIRERIKCADALLANGHTVNMANLNKFKSYIPKSGLRWLREKKVLNDIDSDYLKAVDDVLKKKNSEKKEGQEKIQSLLVHAVRLGDLDSARRLVPKIKAFDFLAMDYKKPSRAEIASSIPPELRDAQLGMVEMIAKKKLSPFGMSIVDPPMSIVFLEKALAQISLSTFKFNIAKIIISKCNVEALSFLIKNGKMDIVQKNYEEGVTEFLRNGMEGYIEKYRCLETLKILKENGLAPKSSYNYALSLSLLDSEFRKEIFSSISEKDNIFVDQIKGLIAGRFDSGNYPFPKDGMILASVEINEALEGMLNLYGYNKRESGSHLDAWRVPYFVSGESYILCGKNDSVAIFSDSKLKTKVDEIPFCLHLEAGLDWNNYYEYKISETTERLMKISYLTWGVKTEDSYRHFYNKKEVLVEGWVKREELLTPITLENENKFVVAFPFIQSKIKFSGVKVIVSGHSDLCSFQIKDVTLDIVSSDELLKESSKKTEGIRHFELPLELDMKDAKIKSNVDYAYSRGCGT